MNANKTFLLLSLALSLVLGWMLWLAHIPVRALSGLEADDKKIPSFLTLELGQATYGSNDSPPKLDAPDRIKAMVEPDEPSPLANAGLPHREKAAPGAVRFKVTEFEKPIGFEDSVEFRSSEYRIRSDWQTPPRLNLKPGGLSTPFSKPDWYDHPPLNRSIDGRLHPKPGGGS